MECFARANSSVAQLLQPQARPLAGSITSPRTAVPVSVLKTSVGTFRIELCDISFSFAVVPFFNVVLRDLFMIDEQSPNMITDEEGEGSSYNASSIHFSPNLRLPISLLQFFYSYLLLLSLPDFLDLSSSREEEAVDWLKMSKVGKQIWKILLYAKVS